MAVVTYKCPNCDGGLIFDPQSQKFTCEYCLSSFTEEELVKAGKASQTDQPVPEHIEPELAAEDAEPQPATGDMMLYTCPSCGAEIVADETTAATFCYYCHNPVVLTGRLEGKFKPDKVVPFVINKEQAVDGFLNWVGKKKFVPRAFFSKKQIEKISGVYFPYWIADCEFDANLSAHAMKVKTWRTGDIQYTQTEHFQAKRTGSVEFEGVPKRALRKNVEDWIEHIHPFMLHEAKDFNEAYLLGFQAEKRNIEREEIEQSVIREAEQNAKDMFKGTVEGYTTVNTEHLSAELRDVKWYYTLLPVWIVTYRNRGDKVYYYAMNGQTGNVSGELPVDNKKLSLLFTCITLVTGILMMIGGLV